jgi:hypothetical protein
MAHGLTAGGVQRIPYAERLISAIVPQPGPGDTFLVIE